MATTIPIPVIYCDTYYPASVVIGDWVCMSPGQSIPACQLFGRTTGVYHLVLQHDANLVLYRTGDKFVKWASNTQRSGGQEVVSRLSYGADGNVGITLDDGALISVESNKLGNTWGTSGLLCLDAVNGVLTLFNAGQSSLTNPVWTSQANAETGGFLVNGYPSTPTNPGPGPVIPVPPPLPPSPPFPMTTDNAVPTTAASAIASTDSVSGKTIFPFATSAGQGSTQLSTLAAPTTSTLKTNENVGSMSPGVIAAISSVGGGLILVALGLVYYCLSHKRNKKLGNSAQGNHPFTRMTPSFASLDKWNDRPDPSDAFSVTSLPVYANGSILMANIPGVYITTVVHESMSEGELSYGEGDEVYVISRPGRHGWCRARLRDEEGWIEAANLGLLD
ncbi:hypothetical protein BDR26DRAFT_1010740 [Obelidium mucronatum]|nr:hypothetical protein BDR26DRAFT_1010740 [Obelidium mucronatum]